ncbi:MAG: carboxypeptidase regulatory-like domain-containing protein [bacterium]
MLRGLRPSLIASVSHCQHGRDGHLATRLRLRAFAITATLLTMALPASVAAQDCQGSWTFCEPFSTLSSAVWSEGHNSNGPSWNIANDALVISSGTGDGAGAWVLSVRSFRRSANGTLTFETRARVHQMPSGTNDGFGLGFWSDHFHFAYAQIRPSGTWGPVGIYGQVRNGSSPQEVFLGSDDPTQWHTFRVVLSDGLARFYIDGHSRGSISGAAVPSSSSMPIRLDKSSPGAARLGSVAFARVAGLVSGTHIAGTVLDSWNEYALPNASVVAVGAGPADRYLATTDESGMFALDVPANASYVVSVAKPGYKPGSIAVGNVAEGSTKSITVSLVTATVVLLHGIFEGSGVWHQTDAGIDFGAALHDSGFSVCAPDLTPTWCPVSVGEDSTSAEAQSRRLRAYVTTSLWAEGVRSFYVVAHSMGGLVARHFIKHDDWIQPADTKGMVPALIMLGTPNHGTELADLALAAGFTIDSAGLLPSIYSQRPCAFTPSALLDLCPRSVELAYLNYDGDRSRARGNSCVSGSGHPSEFGLGSATRYVNIAGTAFFDAPSCSPHNRLLEAGGAFLRYWTGCSSDGAVPWDSAFLTRPGSVAGFDCTAEQLGCLSEHLDPPSCTPMTQDPCILERVVEVLRDPHESSCPPASRADKAGDSAVSATPAVLVADALWVRPGDTRSRSFTASDGDSLDVRFYGTLSDLVVTLTDASGRVIDADTAAVDPNIDYDDGGGRYRYLIRGVGPGLWNAVVQRPAASDPESPVGIVVSEYAGIDVRLALARELTPSDMQRLEASLTRSGAPVSGAGVRAVVADPFGASSVYQLGDDGQGGDTIPGDGVYTALLPPLPDQGQYGVTVEVRTGAPRGDTAPVRTVVTTFRVDAMSDVAIDGGSLVLDPPVLDVGQVGTAVVAVHGSVRNVGGSTADSVDVRFIEGGAAFATVSVGTLAPGQAVPVEAEWPSRYGTSQFSVVVEATTRGAARDRNPANDRALKTLRIVRAGVQDVEHTFSETDAPAEPDRGVALESGAPAVSIVTQTMRSGVAIVLTLGRPCVLDVGVYDVGGRRVAVVVDQEASDPGLRRLTWAGTDGGGGAVPAGVYFVRISAGAWVGTRKVVLVR